MGFEDRWLVGRLRAGDPAACRRLIEAHHAKVFSYLRWMGADRDLAADLTQETYAKAWRGIRSIRNPGSLRAWLLRIARNEYLQVRRRRSVDTCDLDDAVASAIVDPAASPQERVEESDRDRRLRATVARLDPSLAEMVVLHYFQDLPLRDVGALLDLPVGTVKSRLHRALDSLRDALEKEERHVESTARTAPARPA